ncbi:glutamate-rich protein 4 isoform X2 [Dasypus novemcinctus]|uniref:glutamate-rich protein 4 isoform X2 n=1 Tax=Dasypus novemcinctus TaxID=9361 RepID=UPI00032904C9|nr:glutamate-rich protein 4 isoform X2 [Dasypus novemcinctus]
MHQERQTGTAAVTWRWRARAMKQERKTQGGDSRAVTWGAKTEAPRKAGWQGHLRRLDDQLLSQLCSLGLALRALREDLAAFQEEEEEEEESSEEAEEEAPPGNQERGASRASCPAPPSRPPDFEMTI